MGTRQGSTSIESEVLSENTHYDKEKAKTPGYDEAREVMFKAQARIKALGWTCHMAYDGHFFLEPSMKQEPS